MDFEEMVIQISSKLDAISGQKKSLIQAELSDMSDKIEDVLFKLHINERNHRHQDFPKLDKVNIQTAEAIGLLFLAYVTYILRSKLKYGQLWPIVSDDLMKYDRITTFFKDNYFQQNHPNSFLIDCINKACVRFDLRNSFEHRDDQHYLRNTILLQIGLLDRFAHLNLWLSGYLNQITIRTLLDRGDVNYSNSFTHGWRVLRRYRDNIIDKTVATSLLKQNAWFKMINIEEALRASRKKLGARFLAENEIESIFFLSQILYDENVLKFIVDAEDLYALHIAGSDYSVYVDDKYAAKVLRNQDHVLILDKKIIIEDPMDFNVSLELKNEDGDVVYSDQIVLFDLHDQVLIFDEKGNIYKDFSKKLTANRTYAMLFDSDLDCDVPSGLQIETFSGYVTLVSGLSKDNNCMLSYDGEELFSLNFTESTEKPEWVDRLVVYAADNKLKLGERTEFHLISFDMDDMDDPLKQLPPEANIIRWTYAGNYVDKEDIQGFVAQIDLSFELVCERKHSFLIRYKDQVYHRTVRSSIYDHSNKHYLIQRHKDGTVDLTSRNSVLNYDDLVQSKFHLALFDFEKSKEPRILKDKMKLYGMVDPNKQFRLTSSPKFGETIIMSEHIYNDIGDILFKVIRQGVIKEYDARTISIKLRSVPEHFDACEFVVLDDAYQISSLSVTDLAIEDKNIKLDKDYISMTIIYEGNYVGSFVQHQKIDLEGLPADIDVLKVLYLSYMPLLMMDRTLLKKWAQENLTTFIKAFLTDSLETPRHQTVYFDFNEVNTTIEHLLFDVEFFQDEAKAVIQDILLNSWADKALEMPILLVYLLTLAQDKRLVSYFLSLLPEIEVPEDRDEHFIETIVNDMFKHLDLDNIEKHNLKIAMHHKHKMFYLSKALYKLQESMEDE